MVVAFTTTTFDTVTAVPAPLVIVTAVAPVKLVPVRVTFVLPVPVAGRVPDGGAIEVSVAPFTVNDSVLVVPPGVFGVVTEMDLAPGDALTGMVQFAVTTVKLGVPVMAQVMAPPVPPVTFTAVAPVRSLPFRVSATVDPTPPEAGLGGAASDGPFTVNVVVAVAPPVTVSVTVRAVSAAAAAIVKVAVTVVAL